MSRTNGLIFIRTIYFFLATHNGAQIVLLYCLCLSVYLLLMFFLFSARRVNNGRKNCLYFVFLLQKVLIVDKIFWTAWNWRSQYHKWAILKSFIKIETMIWFSLLTGILCSCFLPQFLQSSFFHIFKNISLFLRLNFYKKMNRIAPLTTI